MKKPFTMKKNSFLSISLLIIWVPVAVRFVWAWTGWFIGDLVDWLTNGAKNCDVIDRIIDPSANSPACIKVAICTTLVLIAIERLRRTIEEGKAGAETPLEDTPHEEEKSDNDTSPV